MSRAVSIWIVTNMRHTVGAFTVRHEMVTWLKKMQKQYGDLSTYSVTKHKDGDPHANKEYCLLEDLLKET